VLHQTMTKWRPPAGHLCPTASTYPNPQSGSQERLLAVPLSGSPSWSRRNLRKHYTKHAAGKSAGCFAELIGRTSPAATEQEYEARSLATIRDAWAEYEAEKWDRIGDDYAPSRATFVDSSLVVCVTDFTRSDIITCFHEHFDSPHGVDPGPQASAGQRMLRYQGRLDDDERGGVVRNVRRIRGV